MSTEANKEIVRKLVDAMSRNDQDTIGDLVASNVVYHNPPPDHGKGAEGRKEYAKILSTVFPQHEETIDDLIAEGDKVAVRWTSRGKHEGSHQKGIWRATPSGKEITVTGITIYRIADGKIAESWANWDDNVLVHQLRAAAT